jgi:hypothetical protein
MTLRTAFLAAVAVTVLGAAAVLLVGLLGRVTIELPGVLVLRSGAVGVPGAELWFPPLAPLVLVVVLTAVIRLVGRAVRS